MVVKQVPNEKIRDYIHVDGRAVPKEFHIHRMAQYTRGVVKVHDWYQRSAS